MTDNDVYTALAARHGYGSSERYGRILRFLMSPRQARLAVSLPMPPEELAAQEGLPVETVNADLEELYKKGVIFPRNFETHEYFRFARGLTQLHDASESLDGITDVYTADEKVQLWTLWEDFVRSEWDPDRMPRLATLQRAPVRVIPAWKAIKDIPGILPAENMKALIDHAPSIAVVSCSCRKRRGVVGHPCEYSHDMNCIQFGRSAEYVGDRGHGRLLSRDEAWDLVEEMEDDGLVHTWPNVAIMGTTTLCSCCVDCCMNLLPMANYEVPWTSYFARSRFEATNDVDVCDGCQDCIERCQFDALSMEKIDGHKKFKAVVNPENCMGCGVCVLVCEPRSLLMELVRPPEHIPSLAAASAAAQAQAGA